MTSGEALELVNEFRASLITSKSIQGLYLGEAEGATEGAVPMVRVWDLVVLVAMAERRL